MPDLGRFFGLIFAPWAPEALGVDLGLGIDAGFLAMIYVPYGICVSVASSQPLLSSGVGHVTVQSVEPASYAINCGTSITSNAVIRFWEI